MDGEPTIREDLLGPLDVGLMTNHMMDSPGNDGLSIAARFDYVRYASVASLADCYGPMAVL